jgi:hypothetical protein
VKKGVTGIGMVDGNARAPGLAAKCHLAVQSTAAPQAPTRSSTLRTVVGVHGPPRIV